MLDNPDQGRSAFAGKGFFGQDSTLPVLRPLAEQMGVSLLLNPEQKVWLVHDKPMADILMWAEYDIDVATLSLVMRDGRTQELGMKVQPVVRRHLREARQLFTIYMKDGAIEDSYILPLLVRETGYYRA